MTALGSYPGWATTFPGWNAPFGAPCNLNSTTSLSVAYIPPPCIGAQWSQTRKLEIEGDPIYEVVPEAAPNSDEELDLRIRKGLYKAQVQVRLAGKINLRASYAHMPYTLRLADTIPDTIDAYTWATDPDLDVPGARKALFDECVAKGGTCTFHVFAPSDVRSVYSVPGVKPPLPGPALDKAVADNDRYILTLECELIDTAQQSSVSPRDHQSTHRRPEQKGPKNTPQERKGGKGNRSNGNNLGYGRQNPAPRQQHSSFDRTHGATMEPKGLDHATERYHFKTEHGHTFDEDVAMAAMAYGARSRSPSEVSEVEPSPRSDSRRAARSDQEREHDARRYSAQAQHRQR